MGLQQRFAKRVSAKSLPISVRDYSGVSNSKLIDLAFPQLHTCALHRSKLLIQFIIPDQI